MTDDAGGEGSQPESPRQDTTSAPRTWRAARLALQLLEILAVARYAVALAAGARATVVIGDAVFRVSGA